MKLFNQLKNIMAIYQITIYPNNDTSNNDTSNNDTSMIVT